MILEERETENFRQKKRKKQKESRFFQVRPYIEINFLVSICVIIHCVADDLRPKEGFPSLWEFLNWNVGALGLSVLR